MDDSRRYQGMEASVRYPQWKVDLFRNGILERQEATQRSEENNMDKSDRRDDPTRVTFGNSQGATMMVPEMTYEKWNEARANLREAIRDGAGMTEITEAVLGPCPAPRVPTTLYYGPLSIRGDDTGTIVVTVNSETRLTFSPHQAEAIAAALLTHAEYARRMGV